MAQRKKGETPDRVYIRTQLTREKIEGYWKVLGFTQDYWMTQCSAASRYEHVLDHLLNMERLNDEDLDKLGKG